MLTVILVGEKSSKTYAKQVCGEQAKINFPMSCIIILKNALFTRRILLWFEDICC